jgi:hypothetical protein
MAFASELTVYRDVALRDENALHPRPARGRRIRASRGRRAPNGTRNGFATGLGWASIGLGAAEVFAPHALARTLGMRGSEPLIQAYGVREIANGMGILMSANAAPWMWGRVGGDALDLATLGAGLKEDNPKRQNVALAMIAVAGIALLDAACAQSLSRQEKAHRRISVRDYSGRSGFPLPAGEMRGAASDFEAPHDMRMPELLRPWTN